MHEIMIKGLSEFIQDKKLFLAAEHKILLAVSGGIDSVVMAHLFSANHYNFGIAHCNFKLRDAASDQDHLFVAKVASDLEVAFYSTEFNTLELAASQKKNIQILARELRYEWLEKIRKKYEFDFIATAHHADDSIETVLYNWTKGTGIKGLKGIPVKNGTVIRPLLFTDKWHIEQFAKSSQITFREDASNLTSKYDRNKIRHHIIPVLKEINPGLTKTLKKNIQNIEAVDYYYQWAIETLRKEVWVASDDQVTIQFDQLLNQPFLPNLLYEWLSSFGVNPSQAEQIVDSLKNIPGSIFLTPTHKILIDRNKLIIRGNFEIVEDHQEIIIPYLQTETKLPMAKLKISYPGTPNLEPTPQFSDDCKRVYLDLDKTDFPLIIRKWKPGDTFKPLGMNGKRQKIQDLFSNLKLSRFEKDHTWIMENALGSICWVIGYRIGDDFKLTEGQTDFTKLEYLNHK